MTTHRILRQVIELDGCPPGTDAALRSQLAALAQRHLQPVIERACDALDAPGRLWRAERLTLDLGPAPLGPDPLRPADEDWGRQLAERLEACLAPALAEALQATDARQADLELLAQFIATGGVPWWADLQDRQLIAAALRRVLGDPPALQSLGLVRAGAAWQRLVACAGEAGAADWLDALLDDDSARALWRPWRDALADVLTEAGGGAFALRSLWWSLALPAAVRGRLDARGMDPAALAAALVAALPGLGAQAMAGAWLWPAWRRAFDRRLSAVSAAGGVAGPTAAALGTGAARWWRALDGPAAAAGREQPAGTASAAWLDWLQRQAADQPAGSLLQRLLAALVAAWPHLPARAREAACGRRAEPPRSDGLRAGAAAAGLPPTLDALTAPGWQALAELLQVAAHAGQLAPVLLEALQAAAAAPQPVPALATLQVALQRAAASGGAHDAAAPVDRRFADTDAIAVADAGLVLLWPFLPTFFARLGWLGEAETVAGASPPGRLRPGRGFASPGLAARAVMLLHGLATGHAAPPLPGSPIAEHLLPLPKLLCGLAPEAPLPALAPVPLPARSLPEAGSDSAAGPGAEAGAEKGADMVDADMGADTDADAAREAVAWAWALGEGDRLLQAAIAQAPILREMSVPAFRASFVLRAGQLGVRDDHWLLRVERTAYDLVRDRFPWAVSVVRLPWMNTTLQVEW